MENTRIAFYGMCSLLVFFLPNSSGYNGSYLFAEEVEKDSLERVWLFNTRSASASRPDENEFEKIRVYQYHEEKSEQKRNPRYKWNPSGFEEFRDSFDPDSPTIILIHGNHFTLQDAVEQGMVFKQRVLKGDKYQLIIWAWPADKMTCNIRKDVQIKARFSEIQGRYLAQFLDKFPPESRVSLVGFSFGGRTICETVKNLSRSQNASSEETQNAPGGLSLRLRNLLLAPAVNQDSVLPRSQYAEVLEIPEKTLLFFNPRDKALRWYPHIYSGHGPQALGRLGVPLAAVSQEVREKVQAINISPISGDRHEFALYFRNPTTNRTVKDFVLFLSE